MKNESAACCFIELWSKQKDEGSAASRLARLRPSVLHVAILSHKKQEEGAEDGFRQTNFGVRRGGEIRAD